MFTSPTFPAHPAWYALSVKPRHERSAELLLRAKDLDVFNPTYKVRRRWSDRVKELDTVLFPGYVFCRFGFARRLAVLNTPCVKSIVTAGRIAAPIPDHEIASIQAILDSGRPAAPCPYLAEGKRVHIASGCFEGLSGTIVRTRSSCRVVVSIHLLQRSVAVEIDAADLHPAAFAKAS